MIQVTMADSGAPLAVRIDPVMEIKPESRKRNLLELGEEDVVLKLLAQVELAICPR